MSAIPKVPPHIVTLIFDAYRASNESWDTLGLSVGSLGQECSRALWYDFRWASAPEVIDGRKVSIFRTGDSWEARLVADLEAIGVEVVGQQQKIRLLNGHVRGKIDGRGTGVPYDESTEHLFEFKSSKAADFRAIIKNGLRATKPLHFVQCQIGMHALGLKVCGYLVVNKDDDDRHYERVEYDEAFCLRLLEKAARVVEAHGPPPRINEKQALPPCIFCKHAGVCFNNHFPRVSCRSCLHATPHLDGHDGDWACDKFSKPLSSDEQKAACPSHLYLPEFVPGRQIAVDTDAETITYQLNDGRTWTDGINQEGFGE